MTSDQAPAVAAKPEQDEKTGRFLTGNIGCGRSKGSRNKLGEDFIKALHDDFEQHGIDAIAQVRQERPQDYIKVIAGLLPKEIRLTDERELTDEELNKRIRDLASVLGDYLSGEAGNVEAVAGSAAQAKH